MYFANVIAMDAPLFGLIRLRAFLDHLFTDWTWRDLERQKNDLDLWIVLKIGQNKAGTARWNRLRSPGRSLNRLTAEELIDRRLDNDLLLGALRSDELELDKMAGNDRTDRLRVDWNDVQDELSGDLLRPLWSDGSRPVLCCDLQFSKFRARICSKKRCSENSSW